MQPAPSLEYGINLPPEGLNRLAEDGRYIVRLARRAEEVDAALRLRFEVFNLELGEGLKSSVQSGRDQDEFDATCHHLIAQDKETSHIIGTYRVRTIEMAGSVEGFYASSEFELSWLPRYVTANAVELGRACIARSHRNRQVLFLLWRGLAAYLTGVNKRFTFGCCSLTSQDVREGLAMLEHLQLSGHMHPTFRVPVKHGFECFAETAKTGDTPASIPKLFEGYLSIGAKVTSPPAIDRRFGTIDFLVLLDTELMDEKLRALFFG